MSMEIAVNEVAIIVGSTRPCISARSIKLVRGPVSNIGGSILVEVFSKAFLDIHDIGAVIDVAIVK